MELCFFLIVVQKLFAHLFAVAAVPADASQAAVDHLDAAEHQLQRTHGQQNGEQDDVPHHGVGRVLAECPQGLVYQVAAVTSASEIRRSGHTHCTGRPQH